jgi:glycosyltransferase involved in cell wall biosynthesis
MACVSAASRLPELSVHIISSRPADPTHAHRLTHFLQENGAAHIQYLGYRSAPEMKRSFLHAEALIFPRTNHGGETSTILEAMGMGLPLLATQTGELPELIEDGVNGFLAQPSHEQDWIRVLRRWQAVSPEKRTLMSLATRDKIRQYRLWSDHMRTLEGIYERVLSE